MLDLIERDMDGMVKHFNNTICDMDIPHKDKITLGAIVVAMGYKYKTDMERIEKDFQKYISDQVNKTSGVYACRYCKKRTSFDDDYSCGCVHTECDGANEWEYGTPGKGESS